MAICANCRFVSPPFAVNCTNCGAPLATPPGPAIAPPVANYSYPGPPQNPPPQGFPQGVPQGVPQGFPQGVPQQSAPPTAFSQQAPAPVSAPAPQIYQAPPQSWQQVYAPPPPPEPPAPPAPPTPTELYELGYNYLMAEGGYPKDTRKAVEYLSQAAGQGVPQAQVELGLLYERGEGVHRDMFKASGLYREAAERGNVMGQFFLGVMYEEGRGVEEDKEMAAKWYRESAEQGCAEAQNNLGVLYLHGLGVPRNNKEAANLFRQAWINGCENAKKNLRVAEEEIRVEQVPEPTAEINLLRWPCATDIAKVVAVAVAAINLLVFIKAGIVIGALVGVFTILACVCPFLVLKVELKRIKGCTISANCSPKEVLRAVEKLFDYAGWVEAPGNGAINRRLVKFFGLSSGPVVSVAIEPNADGTHDLFVDISGGEFIGSTNVPKFVEKAIRMRRSIIAIAQRYGD